MANQVKAPPQVVDSWYAQLFDDFWWYVTAHLWTSTLSDSGTIAVGNTANGVALLTPSDGSVADNDEAYLGQTAAAFLLAANRGLCGDFLVQFTEANTNAANVAVGFASSIGANLIVDDGGGMRTSGTILAIYKVDGETVWRCVSRNGSSATVSQSTTTAGGSDYQHLSIQVVDWTPTTAEVVFLCNDLYLRDSNNIVIRHTIALSGASQMGAFAGVKNGSTSLETLNVDYIGAAQTR